MKFQHRQKPLQKIEGEIFVTTKKNQIFLLNILYDMICC